jgi:hypothetical protein
MSMFLVLGVWTDLPREFMYEHLTTAQGGYGLDEDEVLLGEAREMQSKKVLFLLGNSKVVCKAPLAQSVVQLEAADAEVDS